MQLNEKIGTLPPSRTNEAVDMFARAFFENPAWRWTLPDPGRRERVLRFFYRAAIRYAFRHGELVATAGDVRGAAIVLPPERARLDGGGLSRAGLWQLPFRAGPRGFARFFAQSRAFEERQDRDAPPQHTYLWEIGVDPAHQGRGIGTSVLGAVIRRCDAIGAPIYIDTTDERNLSLYLRHGFRVKHHASFAPGACRFWTLLRDPEAGASPTTH